jgi:hypothetical protein
MVTFLKVPMTVSMTSGVKPDCINSVVQKQASVLFEINRSEIG